MNQGKSSNTQQITERDRDSDMQYICRNYHMAYIPSGFWSRLIARLIIAVHKWGMIVGGDSNSVSNGQQSRGMLLTSDYWMVFWKEGLKVVYGGGYFLVESFNDENVYL